MATYTPPPTLRPALPPRSLHQQAADECFRRAQHHRTTTGDDKAADYWQQAGQRLLDKEVTHA